VPLISARPHRAGRPGIALGRLRAQCDVVCAEEIQVITDLHASRIRRKEGKSFACERGPSRQIRVRCAEVAASTCGNSAPRTDTDSFTCRCRCACALASD